MNSIIDAIHLLTAISEMYIKNQLQEEIKEIYRILVTAYQAFEFSFYLNQPSTEEEEKYSKSSTFFRFTEYTFWRVLVVELSKLLSENKQTNKFNVRKLLSKLKSNGHYRKLGFDGKLILEWENELEIKESTIQEILDLRDKIYSHSDPQIVREDVIQNIKLTYGRTKELLDFLG